MYLRISDDKKTKDNAIHIKDIELAHKKRNQEIRERIIKKINNSNKDN